MLTKNNARSLAKVSRAKAEVISELILAHPSLGYITAFGQGVLGCLGLWLFTWLMYFAFGAF